MASFAARSAVIFSLAEAELYCPSASDFVVAYGGGVSLKNQGWSVQGDGGAATKASFNLNGGYVAFDLDVSAANEGVIPNIYSIFPSNIGDAFDHNNDYCDNANNDKAWCAELDWVESNGHCGGHAAMHMIQGKKQEMVEWKYSSSKISFRVGYDNNGKLNLKADGQQLKLGDDNDFAAIKTHHQQQGAVIYSSQWTGNWVPAKSKGCGSGGDLGSSSFSISNLVISGSVVQGPTPNKCPGFEEEIALEANSSVLV